jgi:hypothetical protein
MTPFEEVGLDIEPILNVFGGADGGVAFAKLRHHFLPDMYALEGADAKRLVVMVKQFSKLCELMLEKR